MLDFRSIYHLTQIPNWGWGLGTGEKTELLMPHAQCPMPNK
ncbi:hypothetical protein [Nostoc sp.]